MELNYNIVQKFKDTDKQIFEFSYQGKNYVYKGLVKYNEKYVRLLENEVLALKRLEQLNVAPLYYYSEFNSSNNFIIEEMIEGNKLSDIKFKSITEVILVMLKIIDKVRVLHKKEIIHCDLKPSNIIVGKEQVFIIDYGISVISGINVGYNFVSLSYGSFKQIKGEKIDESVDVYALGVIFYELVVGSRPFGTKRKEIIDNKKNGFFYPTRNVLLNEIFKRLFSIDEYKMTLDELESLLKLFLN